MAGLAGNYGYTGQQVNQSSMVVFINDDGIVSSYLVAPGVTVALINLDSGKMYIKSTAVNGMPNQMRTFDIKEVLPQKQTGDSISRQEFEAFSQSLGQQLQGLQQALAGLQIQSQPQQINQVKGGKGK